jgi:hypothetical protein
VPGNESVWFPTKLDLVKHTIKEHRDKEKAEAAQKVEADRSNVRLLRTRQSLTSRIPKARAKADQKAKELAISQANRRLSLSSPGEREQLDKESDALASVAVPEAASEQLSEPEAAVVAETQGTEGRDQDQD